MRMNFYDTRLTDGGRVSLVKEKGMNYIGDRLNSPEAIALMAYRFLSLGDMAEEYVYMIAMATKEKVIGLFLISKGTVNTSLLSPREIYIRALLSGATSIVLIHNHPSGFPEPSKIDMETTEKVKDAGKLVDIPLLDHIIIGDNTYFSFKEAELL